MYTVGNIVANLGVRDAQFHTAFARANATMGTFEKGVMARGASMQAALAGVLKIGGGVAALATIVGGVAVKKFASFEKEMRNVNTIAKEGDEQFRTTSTSVLDMAMKYGSSSVDLAKALYNINSASFTAAKGLQVLEAATIAGRAGVSDTTTAAAGITAVLNAYGLQASEAGDISDILFKTVEKGVISFGELSSHLGTAVASANLAGISFDQVGAAVATITKGGINAAEAFTALNRFMLKMVEGGDELDKVFKAAGYESAKAALEIDGLGKSLNVILEASKGDAKALMDMGFEMRSFKAVASLAREEGKVFAKDLEAIAVKSSRAGATQAALAEQTKATSFGFEKFGATVSVVMIKIGEKLAPFVSEYLTPITDWLQEAATNFDFVALGVEINARKLYAALSYNIRQIAGIATVVAELGSWLWSWWKIQFNLIVNAFTAVYDALKTTMKGLFDIVTNTFSNIWDVITGKKSIGAAVASVSHSMGQGINEAMSVTMDGFAKMGNDAMKETGDLMARMKGMTEGGLFGLLVPELGWDALDKEFEDRLGAMMVKKSEGIPGLTDAVAASVEAGVEQGVAVEPVLPTMFAGAAEKGSTEAYSMLRKSQAEQNEIKNSTKKTAKNTEEIAKNTRGLEAPVMVAI